MSKDTVVMVVHVSPELKRWFTEDFLPMSGAQQWFLHECLTKAREAHQEGRIESPVDIVEAVVRKIGKDSL